MSKEEDQGLLSRMVRFVRNPTVSWSDLDQSDLDQSDLDSESRYSKQMLKDMIERRRRNDFVRKREFDMLRKLRRESLVGAQEAGARPSFFQSSNHNKPDERAKTIKKIDEIEAQMSQQWWKTKHGDSEGGPESQDNPNTDFSVSFPDNLDPSEFRRDKPAPNGGRPSPRGGGHRAGPLEASSFQSTELQAPGEFLPTRPPAPIRASQVAGLTAHPEGNTAGFSYSKLNAIQVAEFTHDPLLEEAAIRFANGDDDGAESALLEALRNPDPAINGNEAIWMTLFDLYRATDRQTSFESVSLDYANRFGRTAPPWFSIPGSVRMHMPTTQEGAIEMDAHWKSPVVISAQTLTDMKAALDKAPQPWCLDWSTLVSVEDEALNALLAVFTAWTDQSVKLRFIGTEHLMVVLKSATVSGDRNINPVWWRIRMQMLRIMHRPDEFEVAALDYCVTYEVSPPSWDGALCNFKSLDGNGSFLTAPPTLLGDSSMHEGTPSELPSGGLSELHSTALASLGSQVSAVDLSGHIMGDAVEMLDALNAKMEGSDTIIVLCARLVRLDFLAAGALLNWVSARQAEGRQVQFKDLHRLVAVFFNVIGINEHAKVTARSD